MLPLKAGIRTGGAPKVLKSCCFPLVHGPGQDASSSWDLRKWFWEGVAVFEKAFCENLERSRRQQSAMISFCKEFNAIIRDRDCFSLEPSAGAFRLADLCFSFRSRIGKMMVVPSPAAQTCLLHAAKISGHLRPVQF